MKKNGFFLLVLSFFFTATSLAAGLSSRRDSGNVVNRSGVATRSEVTEVANVSTVSARNATVGRNIVSRVPSGIVTLSSTPGVVTRSAKTQNVIGTATTVATATQNVAVTEKCRQLYFGCMDAFCMLDNSSGGRCLCSDRNSEFDSILAEIEKLDQQTYMLVTAGVNLLDAGLNFSQLKSNANISNNNLSLISNNENKESETDKKDNEKIGSELYKFSDDICVDRITECEKEIPTLQLMYSQQIKSDCVTYENSLNQLKAESNAKLVDAQRALQATSLNKQKDKNKYDLGQCVSEFKKCMQTTAECGEDFSNCAVTSAYDTVSNISEQSKYSIFGETTSIEISLSMYNTLLAKKPICDSVTSYCTDVSDYVWDTFLREVGPDLKFAESIAEDNARQSCIGSISDCFQKACKDNIDPNDPDGSYDMCLTRPASMLNFCKTELNYCGIDSSSIKEAEKSQIWEYVVSRLASMRVDSCTLAVKECLQSEDRCGADYTKCVGLDTDTIIRMCPYDKLTGCTLKYNETEIRGTDVYDDLFNMVQGIMLNIDNNLLEKCQEALNLSMIKVCGNTDNCDEKIISSNLGANSLEYKICQYSLSDESFTINYDLCVPNVDRVPDTALGRVFGGVTSEQGPIAPLSGIIDGTIYWENIEAKNDGTLTSADEYFELVGEEGITEFQKERVSSEIASLERGIKSIISAIESDPMVQWCKTGRDIEGVIIPESSSEFVFSRDNDKNVRFPNLTNQMNMKIANSALKKARDNYYIKYNEYNDQMTKDYVELAKRIAENRKENAKDARREAARISCVSLAQLSSLPKSKTPKSSIGTAIVITAIVIAVVVVSVFTFGAGAIAAGAGSAAAASVAGTGAAATAAGTAAASAAVAGSTAVGAVSAGISAGISAGVSAGASLGASLSIAATASTAAYSAAMASLAASAIIAPVGGAVGFGLAAGGAIAQWGVGSGDVMSNSSYQAQLNGRHETDQWNFKEVITTDFDVDTLVCHKCVETTQCEKIKTPVFGEMSCKKWEDPVETCMDIQF